MVTAVAVVTAVVVIAKLPVVAPAVTVTEAGTVAAALLLVSATTAPPAGAAVLSVTVPVLPEPPVTVAVVAGSDGHGRRRGHRSCRDRKVARGDSSGYRH